jgi:hypothetical protein
VTRKAYSTRGQLFDGHVVGRLVVSRSTQPLLDACRVLAGEGVDPSTRLVMRYEGQDYDALRSAVVAAAKLAMEEGKRRPIFRPWRPRETAALSSSMRQNERPVSDSGPRQSLLYGVPECNSYPREPLTRQRRLHFADGPHIQSLGDCTRVSLGCEHPELLALRTR